MRNNFCNIIMNEIDGGNGILTKEAVGHINKCPDCRAYFEVSEHIKSFDESEDKVEFWNEFRISLEERKGRPKWIAPAFAALSFCVILAFFAVFIDNKPKDNINANAGVNVSSAGIQADYTDDNSDLDYYYKISADI